jgi:hypothetical protein
MLRKLDSLIYENGWNESNYERMKSLLLVVLYDASFSELSIFDCPFGIL